MRERERLRDGAREREGKRLREGEREREKLTQQLQRLSTKVHLHLQLRLETQRDTTEALWTPKSSAGLAERRWRKASDRRSAQTDRAPTISPVFLSKPQQNELTVNRKAHIHLSFQFNVVLSVLTSCLK